MQEIVNILFGFAGGLAGLAILAAGAGMARRHVDRIYDGATK